MLLPGTPIGPRSGPSRSTCLTVAVALAVALAAGEAPAQEEAPAREKAPAGELLEAVAERYRAAGSLCANFHQLLDVPLLDQRREGRGRLCQRRPNLFSMRFDDPEGDLIVVDGEHVWVYYPSRDPDQVVRASLDRAAGGGAIDLHREFLEDAAEKYRIGDEGTERIGGVRTRRLGLVPKGRARFERAVLWIDPARELLRRVRIHDENGSVRTLELSGIELGVAVPEGTFRFTPPANARVVGS